MRTMMVSVAAALVAVCATAQQKTTGNVPMHNGKPITQKIDREKLRRVQMKKFGGFIRDTREQRGKVVIVNAQSAASEAWLDAVVGEFSKNVKIAFGVEKGAFTLTKPELKGEASLFVVDDPALPMSLVAPEARWVAVNVAPLRTEKAAFFEARVKKELTRGMAYLLGAADSQYPMCLTGCVTKPEDLDQFAAARLPVDIISRMNKYPAGYGITPYKQTTYKNAVHEGWAHQPTNEWQKAIWDEIHTLPTKPITIEPEKK